MPKLKRRRSLRKGKRGARHPETKRRKWTIRMLVSKTGGRCEYCSCQTTRVKDTPTEMTIDHIVPVSRGGSDEVGNLRLACRRCNEEKGSGVSIDVFTFESSEEEL